MRAPGIACGAQVGPLLRPNVQHTAPLFPKAATPAMSTNAGSQLSTGRKAQLFPCSSRGLGCSTHCQLTRLVGHGLVHISPWLRPTLLELNIQKPRSCRPDAGPSKSGTACKRRGNILFFRTSQFLADSHLRNRTECGEQRRTPKES